MVINSNSLPSVRLWLWIEINILYYFAYINIDTVGIKVR